MLDIAKHIRELREKLPSEVVLIAVSKTKPNDLLMAAYEAGQRDFGENYVQELVDKAAALPKDIRWHFIGHLQTNKVKYLAPFIDLIHAVDSMKLLLEIGRQAAKNNRTIDILLQVHIAEEETKFGWTGEELKAVIAQIKSIDHVRVRGLMAMASNTDNNTQISAEFRVVKSLFNQLKASDFAAEPDFDTLSMGMSGDWPLAVAEGSSMVRVGSTIFGQRNYSTPS